jgi:hypothetical protein
MVTSEKESRFPVGINPNISFSPDSDRLGIAKVSFVKEMLFTRLFRLVFYPTLKEF